MDTRVSIVIPNFNGEKLLKENIPILLKHSSVVQGVEIIVVDDGSTDSSVAFLKTHFPHIHTVSLDKNYGFSYACNRGFKDAKGDIVYLLNTDIKVCENFLEPLMSHFKKDDTFAVSSLETTPTAKSALPAKTISIALVKFKLGIFWYWYDEVNYAAGHEIELFCVSGGHAAFDRKKFLSLGGFDRLFSPFYAEDGDICWRAWRKGWRSFLEPKSCVRHVCKGTIARYYSKSKIQTIHWKNRFLLTWKNVFSGKYMFAHLLFLIPELLVLPFCGKKEFTRGFLSACAQFSELIKSIKRDKIINPVYSNAQLFSRFRKENYSSR